MELLEVLVRHPQVSQLIQQQVEQQQEAQQTRQLVEQEEEDYLLQKNLKLSHRTLNHLTKLTKSLI